MSKKKVMKTEEKYLCSLIARSCFDLVRTGTFVVPEIIEKNGKKYISTRNSHGWLRSMLLACDMHTTERWMYWMKVVSGELPRDFPIPQINFLKYEGGTPAVKNIMDCLDKGSGYNGVGDFMKFVDWVLWGFGDRHFTDGFPDIDLKTDDAWASNFDLVLHFLYPGDNFGYIFEQHYCSKSSSQSRGFFSTPSSVSELMARMVYGEDIFKPNLSLMEPCAGTGRMLLPTSNYCNNMYAMEINYSTVKVLAVNGYLYMPWLVANKKVVYPEEKAFLEKQSLSFEDIAFGFKYGLLQETNLKNMVNLKMISQEQLDELLAQKKIYLQELKELDQLYRQGVISQDDALKKLRNKEIFTRDAEKILGVSLVEEINPKKGEPKHELHNSE